MIATAPFVRASTRSANCFAAMLAGWSTAAKWANFIATGVAPRARYGTEATAAVVAATLERTKVLRFMSPPGNFSPPSCVGCGQRTCGPGEPEKAAGDAEERRVADFRRLFDLSGKTVLILGAASGIGKGSARVLAGLGAHLICSDIDEAGVRVTADETGADVILCDAADGASVRALAETIGSRYPRLDAAVTTPGMNIRKRIVDFEETDFDRIVALNLKGTFLFLQAFMKLLIAQGHGGSIVASSSVRAVTLEAGLGVYASTKAGIGRRGRRVRRPHQRDCTEHRRDGLDVAAQREARGVGNVRSPHRPRPLEPSRRNRRRGRLSRLRRLELRERFDLVLRRRLDGHRRTPERSDADATQRTDLVGGFRTSHLSPLPGFADSS